MSNLISNNTKKTYTSKELSSITGKSRDICIKILDYIGINKEDYTKGKKYLFTDYHLQKLQEFLSINSNTSLFFRKKTCLRKYGVSNVFQSREIKEKIKNSCLEKYGTEFANQSDIVKNKIKDSCMKSYGVENPFQSKEIIAKIQNTMELKYGHKHALDVESFKKKFKSTCLARHGVEVYSKSPEFIEKFKSSNLKKYGVDYYSRTDDCKDKVKNTCITKYGVPSYTQTEDYKRKSKATCLEKYGVTSPSKNNIIKEKTILSIKQDISSFEKNNNCTSVSNLISLYGQSWYVYLDIPRICYKKYRFIDNKYIQQIKEYSEVNHGGISITEKDVLQFITSIYSGEIIENSKNVIPPQELDIYIPEKKLAIEFNGNYFHSVEYGKDKKYHENKSKACEEKSIRLIHIYECEWNYSQEKIKSLLRLALGVGYSKIGARLCEIRKISNKEAEPFNEANHLQGHRSAQVTYGLFYKNELQQLMSFSRNKKYEWEIIRGCPGSNNQVVGGVSKLFKAFVKEYNPSSVFSYCDFNKFDGKGYEALGMKFIGYTGPDKFYVDKSGVKVPRNPHKRKELEENCKFTVWGSGSKKYLWSELN